MKAEISLNQLWGDSALMDFFFGYYATANLEELMKLVEQSEEDVIDCIDSYYDDIDECEKDFSSGQIDELIEQLGLTPIEADGEDEDED